MCYFVILLLSNEMQMSVRRFSAIPHLRDCIGIEQVSQNVKKVHEYIKSTVTKVKETNHLKEDSATNGPQGIVSLKTQNSVEFLLNGVNSLRRNATIVNSEYKDNIDWQTLLTTQVEDLHAEKRKEGSFRVSGTKIWNSLPLKLRRVQELTRFKSGLKKLSKSS